MIQEAYRVSDFSKKNEHMIETKHSKGADDISAAKSRNYRSFPMKVDILLRLWFLVV